MPAPISFFAVVVSAVLVGGCTAWLDEPVLTVAAERPVFTGASERMIFRVRAVDADGNPGTGRVTLTAPVGRFLNEVSLVDGFGTATFVCAPSEQAACQGPVRIGAEWQGVRATTQVTVAQTTIERDVKWEVIGTGSTSKLLAIAAAADGSAWAVGEAGAVLHLVGKTWSPVPTGVTTTLRAITFGADGQPIVGGDEGVLLALRGESFERLAPGFSGFITALAVDEEGAVHVGTRDGKLLRIEDKKAVVQLTAPGPVQAMASRGADVWAVGAGFTARWVPETWLLVPSPAGARLSSVTAAGDSLVFSGLLEGNERTYGVLVTGPAPAWASSALPVEARTAAVDGDERFALTITGLYRQIGTGAWEKLDDLLAAEAMTSRGAGDLVLVGPAGSSLLRTR